MSQLVQVTPQRCSCSIRLTVWWSTQFVKSVIVIFTSYPNPVCLFLHRLENTRYLISCRIKYQAVQYIPRPYSEERDEERSIPRAVSRRRIGDLLFPPALYPSLTGVFYYAGAATAAGQSYTGALLVSRDGSWPEEGHMGRVEKAFDTCGIKLWELCEVGHSRI